MINTATNTSKIETPTLLDVLDAWGRENEKRMQRKHSPRRDQRNKYN